MSLKLKLNFIKGWPNPHIDEFIGKAAANVAVDEGKIARRDANGNWLLGISAQNQVPYVLWNGAARDGDHGVPFDKTASTQQVKWGGIQGISHNNPIEYETAQYAGNPVFGDSLYADTDGVLKICAGSASVSNKVIVATVTQGVHQSPGSGVNMITVVPDNSRRVTS
jgi:hypothetical protein